MILRSKKLGKSFEIVFEENKENLSKRQTQLVTFFTVTSREFNKFFKTEKRKPLE